MALQVNIEKNFKGFSLRTAFESTTSSTGILGASGSGKSMTLRCIAGIETPDKGKIVINGRIVFDSEKKINLKPQAHNSSFSERRQPCFRHAKFGQLAYTVGDYIRFISNFCGCNPFLSPSQYSETPVFGVLPDTISQISPSGIKSLIMQ